MTEKARFWKQNTQGMLLNQAQREHLKAPFLAPMQAAIAVYITNIEADLHSIYISGAIPRGDAVPRQPILGMIAVLAYHVDAELVMQDWLPVAEEKILTDYADILRDVQLELFPQGYVFREPEEFSIGAFMLRTNALCVWGNDISPELPEYSLHHEATRLALANDDILQFLEVMQEAQEEILADDSPENVVYWSRLLCEHMLFAAYSLILNEVKQYTRNLELISEQITKLYPGFAAMTQTTLKYTLNPINDRTALMSYLTTHGNVLKRECERWLDKHNPQRHEFFLVVDDDETL